MAIFFALLTLFGWGVGDIFVTIASRRLGALVSYYWALVFGFIVIAGLMPFMGGISDMTIFLFAIVLNIIHTIGNVAFFRGLEVGNASIVGTITGMFSMVSVILSIVFLKEIVSYQQILGVTLALAGVILVSLKLSSIKNVSQIFTDKGVVYALVSLFCWGFYFAFVRITSEKIGWFWAAVPLFIIALFLPLFSKNLRSNAGKIFQDKKGLTATIIYLILALLVADFSYNIGILRGYTSIIAPIAGSSTVLFVILSRFVFKEKLSLQQKVGIISSLIGIVLISFASF